MQMGGADSRTSTPDLIVPAPSGARVLGALAKRLRESLHRNKVLAYLVLVYMVACYAVGWAVGIAMQLRALAQRSGRQIVLSADAARAAGLPAGAAQTIKLGPRGNEQAIEILALAHARDLPVDTTT